VNAPAWAAVACVLAACGSKDAPGQSEAPPAVEEARPEPARDDPPPDPEPSAPAPKAQLPLHARATIEVSSSYPGWPASNAVDGDEQSSWYSGSNDSVAQGRQPFVHLTFKDPAPLRSVRILGNRDPNFFNGYAILEGRLDVFDAGGRLVATITAESKGERHDFAFELPREVEGIGALRFTSTRDEGKRNWWGDVAIAEIIVE